AALLLLEEHGDGHVRVGSAIEHDDVGQSARVGPGEEHEPGLLAEDALERPAAAGLARHDEDSYHDSATARERRTHASTAAAGTANGRAPCIIVFTSTTLPATSACGPPEKPGARRTSARIHRGGRPSRPVSAR